MMRRNETQNPAAPDIAPVDYRFDIHQTTRLASFLRIMNSPGAEDRRKLFLELKRRAEANDFAAPLVLTRQTLHRLKLGFAGLWDKLATADLLLAKKCCDELGIWSWVEPLVQPADDVEDQGEPLDFEPSALDASAATAKPTILDGSGASYHCNEGPAA